MAIKHISAITLAVRDMARAVEFYQALGFKPAHGNAQSSFISLRAGEAFVNLALTRAYQGRWWGRAIFRVRGVDRHYRQLVDAGLRPDPPTDAAWGERFFHITDPDGHELSFAEPLPANPLSPDGADTVQ
ncbi:MAG: VOC family protein [Phycisphaeraceae bacterium]